MTTTQNETNFNFPCRGSIIAVIRGLSKQIEPHIGQKMKKNSNRLAILLACAAVVPAGVAHAQETAAIAADNSNYRVLPGDQIEIYVWGEERLQRTVAVLPDGTLAFPLVGQVKAAGYSLSEIESSITEALRPEYRGEVPRVTVSVVATAGLQFAVMGRVNSPGTFQPGRPVNVLEALAFAGGPSEFADLDDVLILRKRNNTLVPIKASLARLFKSRVSQNDIERANILAIEPGDTIIVP